MSAKFICILATVFLILISGYGSFAQTLDGGQVIEVPFEFLKNEVVVQVKINGKGPFNMMLDTGTDPSAIDLNTAKEIGLKLNPVGHKSSGTGTSVNLAYATKFPLVEIGGLQVKDIEAAAIDLSKVSERMGKPMHGILGQSLL